MALIRNTVQKKMILDVFRSTTSLLSAEGIYEKLGGSIAKSTIYRNIPTLVENGLLELHYLDGCSMYKIGTKKHSHYLICDVCHSMTPISGCNIRFIEKKAKRETGFIIKKHHLQINGTCRKCAKGKK
ncbi:MAG: transcriptional repressor [Deltaproteobacteria bacterium]|jgi:Fe2+ or Zn2+ uptake regulation protein|nr:transcriptional repressor [Deltaproteobacteria bacterium]